MSYEGNDARKWSHRVFARKDAKIFFFFFIGQRKLFLKRQKPLFGRIIGGGEAGCNEYPWKVGFGRNQWSGIVTESTIQISVASCL